MDRPIYIPISNLNLLNIIKKNIGSYINKCKINSCKKSHNGKRPRNACSLINSWYHVHLYNCLSTFNIQFFVSALDTRGHDRG